jgi:hypothetical protein
MEAVTAGGHRTHETPILGLSHVSYLAQTRKPAPVIVDSPECVDGAANADS